MSYGYPGQGGPYSGQNPPTSFGAPPGTPNPQYPNPNNPNMFYPNAPQNVRMPQPFEGYMQPDFHSQGYPAGSAPRTNPPPYPQHMPAFPQPFAPASNQFCNEQPYAASRQMPTQSMPQPLPRSMPAPLPSQPYPRANDDRNWSQAPGGHCPPPSSMYPPPSSMYPVIPNSSSSSYFPGNDRFQDDYGGRKFQDTCNSVYPGANVSGGVPRRPNTGLVGYKLSPTATPCPNFDPRADAEVLRKAMKGFGTDEKSIISVLANRSNAQRQEIALQFKTLYGKDLIKDLKSETSGNFEKLLVAMMTPLPEFYAKELHDAMSGIGTDETVLVEIMCSLSNYEIRTVSEVYESMYGKTLEEALRDDTSGCFKRLMVSLACGNRDESFDVDEAAAQEDARRLLQAGELQFGTDESVFNSILVQRSMPQLQCIFYHYENITGHTVEQAIEREFSGDIKKGLLAIVDMIKNRAGFFAEQLHKSMKGMGTDDSRLIRLVVTRSEIDMGEIKEAYAAAHGKSLEDRISSDCSGHYKKCLVALITN